MADIFPIPLTGSTIDSRISEVPNKLDKTGGIMTGDLLTDNKKITIATTIEHNTIPASGINSGLFGFMSSNTNPSLIGYLQTQKTSSSGEQGIKLAARKTTDTQTLENYLLLRSDTAGNAIVTVSHPNLWKDIIGFYPVGSVICMSTNSPPSYGTWQLIDKEFAYYFVSAYTPTLNTTNCTTAEVRGFRKGHNILLYFSFTNKIALTDTYTVNGSTATSIQMFTIDPAKFGLTSFNNTRNITHFSDAGNVVLIMALSPEGVLSVADVFVRNSSNPTTNLAAGTAISTITIDISACSYTQMNDSACNKFYFKRTA